MMTAKIQKPADYRELARQLCRNGYWPIPYPTGTKYPAGEPTWQTWRFTENDVDAVFPQSGINIGVLHVNVGAFDIDVEDEEIALRIRQEALRRFPGALLRIGKAPKSAIVFRIDSAWTVVNTRKRQKISEDGEVFKAQVEVRTKSGQMVAYGKHPETHGLYVWPNGELWETPIDNLPLIDELDAMDFRDWCEKQIAEWADDEAQLELPRASAPVINLGLYRDAAQGDDRPSEEAFLQALSYVPASYGHNDGWCDTLMAIHNFYAGSFRGLEVAKSWSAGDSRYNPREVEQKWKSFDASKGLSYKTVFHFAKLHGADLSQMAIDDRKRREPTAPQAIAAAVASSAPFQIATHHTEPQEAPTAATAPPAGMFWADEATPVMSSQYLVKGWIGSKQMSVVYGPSNVGKSFFVLDLAFCVSAGLPWHGCKVRQGVVLYLAAEGGNGYHSRVFALRRRYAVDGAKLLTRPAPINFLRPDADLPVIAKLCADVAAEHGPIAMIVVDTLSRAMAGGNENGPEDMTAFIGNVDALRDYTGAHILVVHHSGKDAAQGARGHSSLRAATDTEIELEVSDGVRIATATKQRDIEPKPPVMFKLRVHELGMDEDGDPVTTCTVDVMSDEDAAGAKVKQPRGANQIALVKGFKDMRAEGVGGPNPGGPGWPEGGHFWTIQEADLRAYVAGKMIGQNPTARISEGLRGLVSSGFMAKNEGKLWITTKEGRVRGSDEIAQ